MQETAGSSPSKLLNKKSFNQKLSHQHSPAVGVQDLSGNKAGMRSTQEQHGSGNFFWLASSSQRDCAVNALADYSILQRWSSHVRFNPARCYAVHIDTVTG